MYLLEHGLLATSFQVSSGGSRMCKRLQHLSSQRAECRYPCFLSREYVSPLELHLLEQGTKRGDKGPVGSERLGDLFSRRSRRRRRFHGEEV